MSDGFNLMGRLTLEADSETVTPIADAMTELLQAIAEGRDKCGQCGCPKCFAEELVAAADARRAATAYIEELTRQMEQDESGGRLQ